MRAYLAVPAADGPWPDVVVVYESAGMSPRPAQPGRLASALALAAGHGYAAASTNYGGCGNAEQVLTGACPVVGSYGGKDRSSMDASAAARLEQGSPRLASAKTSFPGTG